MGGNVIRPSKRLCECFELDISDTTLDHVEATTSLAESLCNCVACRHAYVAHHNRPPQRVVGRIGYHALRNQITDYGSAREQVADHHGQPW